MLLLPVTLFGEKTKCENVGDKVIDESIDTKQIIANVLIPEEVITLPNAEILTLEWPVEILAKSEEQVVLSDEDKEQSLSMFDIQLIQVDVTTSMIEFQTETGEFSSYPQQKINFG